MKDHIILLSAAVFIVAFVGYSYYNRGANSAEYEQEQRQERYEATDAEAFDICQKFVKRRLKALGSATFARFYEVDNPVSSYGNSFTVRAWVDAQNNYGAELRRHYTCEVTHAGGGTYNLDELSFQ